MRLGNSKGSMAQVNKPVIYNRAIQKESTKNLRQSGSTMLQEDAKLALFHLGKKKGTERLPELVFFMNT